MKPPGFSGTVLSDLSGRTAVVTGASPGSGFKTRWPSRASAAGPLLACRDPERGGRAADEIRARVPAATVEFAQLDLADLGSVRHFAASHRHGDATLDLLVNNAGVVLVPQRRTTVDGFELHLGTNHLGHFALTGLLMPAL